VLKISGFILGLCLCVAALFYAAIKLPTFEKWRRSTAEAALSNYLERTVTVSGDVEVLFGWHTRLVLSDVSIKDASWTTSDRIQKIGRAEFLAHSLKLVTGGNVELTGLVLEQARINVEVDENGVTNFSANPGNVELPEPLAALSDFLRSNAAQDLVLRDVQFTYHNASTGWSAVNSIHSFSSRQSSDGQQLTIEGKGTLNKSPVSLSAVMETSETQAVNPAPAPFNISLIFPGAKTSVAGTIDLASEIAKIGAKLDIKSASIGDLLTTFEIERALEGNGEFSGNISGPLNGMSLDQIAANAKAANGNTFTLQGKIGNLATGDGLELAFSGDLSKNASDNPASETLYNLSATGFSGKLSGTPDAILIKDFHLATNAFDADLQKIGPVSVEKVVRDDTGRIGLEGVKVLAGPPEKPFLELSGAISDALNLSGFTLDGRLDIDTATVLGFQNDKDASGLGRLKGEIALSDSDGKPGLEKLEARVANSKLIALDVSLVIDDLRHLDEVAFQVELDIPNFQRFALALGAKVKKIGPVKFKGRLSGGGQNLLADGNALFGKTAIAGKLEGSLVEGGTKLSGNLSTPLLHVQDIRNIFDVQKLIAAQAHDAMPDQFDARGLKGSMQIGLDVKAAKIAGAGKSASKLDARLKYNDGVVRVDPFRVRYLGGQITSNLDINLKQDTPRIKARGSMNDWRIGNTLKQMGAGGTLTGTVRMNFNLSASGSTPQAWLKSLNGKTSVYLRNGTVGSSLIDLSGLSLPGWLFSKSSAGGVTKLVCAVAPIAFKNGRGSVKPLVLETENVQIVGVGSIDFRKSIINIKATPRAKRPEIAGVATPFTITGKLSNPKINLQEGAGTAKVVGETLLLPLSILGALFKSDIKNTKASKAAACKISKPTAKSQKSNGRKKKK
jgi:uncharacterized protein involved in outer membrane biogenesis